MSDTERHTDVPSERPRQSRGRIVQVLALLIEAPRALSSLIWAIIALVILAHLGRLFLPTQSPEKGRPTEVREVGIPSDVQMRLDGEVADALRAASAAAEAHGRAQLAEWVGRLMENVDPNFLNWFFGYWHQQYMGLQALFRGVVHWVDTHTVESGQPTAEESLTLSFQSEFTARVLRPEIAKLELERMTREVVHKYVETLRAKLQVIPTRYALKEADWHRYLSDLSRMGSRTDRAELLLGDILKAGTVAAAVGIGAKLTAPIGAMGAKVLGSFAGKAGAKLAAKTGGKVAGKAAGGWLAGPIIGVGILLWDVWDTKQTAAEQRPILKRNIEDFLHAMAEDLLKNPETGMMAAIAGMEGDVLRSLQSRGGQAR